MRTEPSINLLFSTHKVVMSARGEYGIAATLIAMAIVLFGILHIAV